MRTPTHTERGAVRELKLDGRDSLITYDRIVRFFTKARTRFHHPYSISWTFQTPRGAVRSCGDGAAVLLRPRAPGLIRRALD